MKPAFKIHSPETATEYWIYLEAPDPRTKAPWPTMVFLDGDDQFAAAVGACRELRAKRKLSPMLLVGVGYGASYGKPANKRGRDYTPTHHGDEPSSGGADAFLRFLTETLWPELGRRHPLDPLLRGLGGHSLSSLLALHAFFQPRPFFNRCLASAPSIWWDDRRLLQQVAGLRASQARLPGRLFLSAGERDSPSMATDLAALEAQLAARPFAGLEVTVDRFPGLNHYNVLPAAFAAGLAALFGKDELSLPLPRKARRPPRPH